MASRPEFAERESARCEKGPVRARTEGPVDLSEALCRGQARRYNTPCNVRPGLCRVDRSVEVFGASSVIGLFRLTMSINDDLSM